MSGNPSAHTHLDPLAPSVAVAVASGLSAACLSAPFIAIIDAAITSNASGRMPLWAAVKEGFSELKRPGYFITKPSFRWIAAVYSATYLVANLTQLFVSRAGHPVDLPKFTATSATNIAMSMAKDRAFAKLYAAHGKVATAFPKPSLVLFGARDALTVAFSFTLPPRLTPIVEQSTGLPHDVARGLVQLTAPLAAQIISVPAHLVALDLYNNPQNADRFAFVRREYVKTLLARWGRILPAFGIGGVINLQVQDLLNEQLGHSIKEAV